MADSKELRIFHNRVMLDNHSASNYKILADGGLNDFDNHDLIDKVQAIFPDSISFEIHFTKKGNSPEHHA
ncbi:MAG: hypothetical protein IPP93_16230 [Chitinophagaceae bacterium]|nr:hypothetical protein [Chitinophagaceae bacterium]